MDKIFKILYKYKKKTIFKKSKEIKFYKLNKSIYKKNKTIYEIIKPNNIFDIIQINIIIKGLINKEKIDDLITKNIGNNSLKSISINEKLKEEGIILPFFNYKNEKIIIPFFNITINKIYKSNFNYFKNEPYSLLKEEFDSFIINPFEKYGLNIYESEFTSFKKIYHYKSVDAFYHPKLETIFIVNNQGYLDDMICLFDKFLKNKNKNEILNKLPSLMSIYFNNNLKDFVYSLYNNHFISYKVFKKICKKKKI